MKYGRLRTSLALAIATPLYIILSTGCATVPTHDPLYNGDPLYTSSDSTTFVPIHIENHRTRDAIDPHFYLRGAGLHPLGIVRGMNGRLDRLIDTQWFAADGCMVIIAHYAGGPDLVFDRFCWQRGQRIEVALDDLFNPVSAWSHR